MLFMPVVLYIQVVWWSLCLGFEHAALCPLCRQEEGAERHPSDLLGDDENILKKASGSHPPRSVVAHACTQTLKVEDACQAN